MEMFPSFVAEGTRTYEILLKPNINTYNLPDDPLLQDKKCFAVTIKGGSLGLSRSRSGHIIVDDFYLSLRNKDNQILIDNYPMLTVTVRDNSLLVFREDYIDTMKSTIYIPPHIMQIVNSNPTTQYAVEIVLHYKV